MAQQTFPKETKFEDLPAAEEGNEWVQNLMSGIWIQEAIDTPRCCSVGSEAYWSM